MPQSYRDDESFQRVELAPPGRAKSWLSLTVDVDAEALWLTLTKGKDRPALISQGLYGLNVGFPRILDLLSDLGIKATFFIPRLVAERHPAIVPEIAAGGHEVASHAYTHQPLSLFENKKTEAEELRRAKDLIEDQLGAAIAGFGAPVCDVSRHTIESLAEQGFRYDRSFLDDDWPYFFRRESGELVELPVSWVLDDFAFFGYNLYPKLGWGIQHPSLVGQIWSEELASFRCAGFGCLVLHPEVIGRRPRMQMLSDVLFESLRSSRFRMCADVASEVADLERNRRVS